MLNARYSTIARFLGKEQTLLTVYVVVTVLASLQQYLLPGQAFDDNKLLYTHYNNYVIFKNSFFHLLTNQNIYALHLTEQWDLFKYSPTFALFMGLLAYLPEWLGLILWNLLNALVLFFGVKHLPYINQDSRVKIRWFILVELLTSIQNSQSNGIILGLFIWSFIYLERGKLVWATLFMLLSAFVKVFGIVGFVLFILYPRKPTAILYTLLWALLLITLPMLLIPYQQLIAQYQNWLVLLQNDHSISVGLSVMGWLTTWFSIDPPKMGVVLAGVLLLLAPLVRTAQYPHYQYRLLLLASILIWVVIFNHRAESPTFIIAIGGVGLWYFSQPATLLNRTLIILAFIFSCLSPTDLFPRVVRDQFIGPYVLKAVFCILIWVKITIELATKDWRISDQATL